MLVATHLKSCLRSDLMQLLGWVQARPSRNNLRTPGSNQTYKKIVISKSIMINKQNLIQPLKKMNWMVHIFQHFSTCFLASNNKKGIRSDFGGWERIKSV